MRKLAAALLAAGLCVGPVAGVSAHAADGSPEEDGAFTLPFREDAAPYDAAANTFGGPRGDNGCTAPDANNHRDCLPAGASQNVLADGRVLYWNAIEGSEDLDQPDEAVVPAGGDLARNDRSRVLSIDWDNLTGQEWTVPENATGYFPAPTEPPLIPGTDNSNPDQSINSDGSLFCSDQKQLADGTILAAGGTNYYPEPRFDAQHGVIELEGVRNARIFDPAGGEDGKGTWKPTGSLNHGRWYPSMVTLPDGDIFIASGVTKLMKPLYPGHIEDSGDNVAQTETYDVQSGAWTDNGEGAARSLPLFPRLHLLPNGHVYYDAAGQSFNPMGQSYKQALWNIAATYDPASKTWSDLGVPGLDASAAGSEPGFRGSTFSQALPFRANADGEYTKASYLTAGGVTLMSPGSWKPTDSTRINTVDVSGGGETLSTAAAGKLGRPRWYSSAVTLPTGQVMAFSGADIDEVISPGFESPIRQAEMFTPKYDDEGNYTGGTWEDVAIAHRRRTYHNNAVLLPDGRVLIGGHAPIPRGYYQPANNPDLPVREASNNFKDASFEIYSPPYLNWDVARPVIGNMSPALSTQDNGQLIIPTPDASDISSVVLVRNPSETHLIDADQRVVNLPIDFEKSTGDALHVSLTHNQSVLPPGPYMLFINKHTAKGEVPSVAKQVFVDASVPGWARGADTYPSDESLGDAQGAGNGGAPLVVPNTPEAAQDKVIDTLADATSVQTPGLPLSARPASSERRSHAPVLALAGVAFLIAAASLVGTRRRAPVRIKK